MATGSGCVVEIDVGGFLNTAFYPGITYHHQPETFYDPVTFEDTINIDGSVVVNGTSGFTGTITTQDIYVTNGIITGTS